jgi:hypothetical protein
VIAFTCIDGYYRHLKSELKKSAIRQRSTMGGSDGGSNSKILVDVDGAARDSVRCLEHAMVIVAGEKVSTTVRLCTEEIMSLIYGMRFAFLWISFRSF